MVYTHRSSSSPPITPSRLPAEVIATSLVHSQSAPGDLSVVVPPVPIPNTAVKHHSANGSRTQGSARVGRCQIIKAALRGGFFASTSHDRSLAPTASMAFFFVAGVAEPGRGAGRGAERFFGRGPGGGFELVRSYPAFEGCGLGANGENRGQRTRLQRRRRRLRRRFGSGFFVAGVADPGAARSVKGYRIRRSRRPPYRTSHRTIFEQGTGCVAAVSYSPTRTSALPGQWWKPGPAYPATLAASPPAPSFRIWIFCSWGR